jgi:hypothetical protein
LAEKRAVEREIRGMEDFVRRWGHGFEGMELTIQRAILSTVRTPRLGEEQRNHQDCGVRITYLLIGTGISKGRERTDS